MHAKFIAETVHVDGAKLAQRILDRVTGRISEMSLQAEKLKVPKLAILALSNREDSDSFLRNKQTMFQRLGLELEVVGLGKDPSLSSIMDKIDLLNSCSDIHGIQIYQPLPLDVRKHSLEIFNRISGDKDVEGLNSLNYEKMDYVDLSYAILEETVLSCTFKSICAVLHEHDVQCKDKFAVVYGKSYTGGGPIAKALKRAGARVKTIDKKTENPDSFLCDADIVVTCAGKMDLFDVGLLKDNSTVLDFGINLTKDKKVKGDLETDSLQGKGHLVARVPGGMGPITSAMVLQNLYILWKNSLSRR